MLKQPSNLKSINFPPFYPFLYLHFQLTRTCPPVSSCSTVAPGWLVDDHPIPEAGVSQKKVCFHYNGDCCYNAIYISVINCPGMFAYHLENIANFSFPARYCFEDDKKCK